MIATYNIKLLRGIKPMKKEKLKIEMGFVKVESIELVYNNGELISMNVTYEGGE